MRAIRPTLFALLALFVLAASRGIAALVSVRDVVTVHWFGSDVTRIFALPAPVLLAMGGASLAALLAMFARSGRGPAMAIVPGALLVGSVVVEALALGRASQIPLPVGIAYSVLGFTVVALASVLGRRVAVVRSRLS